MKLALSKITKCRLNAEVRDVAININAKNLFTLIALSLLLMSACSKNKTVPEDNMPLEGQLYGFINPAGAATEVIATSITNPTISYKATFEANGKFVFPKLAYDSYVIKCSPTSGFLAGISQMVTIKPGQTNQSLNITMQGAGGSVGTGILVGTIFPANAVNHIALTGQAYFYTIPDPVTGAFQIKFLPDGIHQLEFFAKASHIAPKNKGITITNGATIDLGTITFAPNERISEFAFKVGSSALTMDTYINNSYQNTRISVSYIAPKLEIVASLTSGSYASLDGVRTKKLTIKLDEVTGPGTYTCKGTEASVILYTDKSTGMMSRVIDVKSEDAAKVIITAFDPLARTVSGTFSGTMKSRLSTITASQDLSSGVFNIKY